MPAIFRAQDIDFDALGEDVLRRDAGLRTGHRLKKAKLTLATGELVWTLTTKGRTERAYASLRQDYFIDDVVNDPLEMRNLIREPAMAGVLAELRAELGRLALSAMGLAGR